MNDCDWLSSRTEARVRELYETPAPIRPEARERLEQALRAEPPPRRSAGIWAWLVEPRLVSLRPVSVALVAVALIAAGMWLGRAALERSARESGRSTVPSIPLAPGTGGDLTSVVRFVFVSPEASSVTLVGDFNAWDPVATPLRRERDGETWTVDLPVPHGRHVYAFVVDRNRWTPDPQAPLAPEDGFGMRNSVVLVGAGGRI